MASSPVSAPSTQWDEFSRNPSQDSMPSVSSQSSAEPQLRPVVNGFKYSSPGRQVAVDYAGLYAESVAAKVWKVAAERLVDDKAPKDYPEWVPHDGETPGLYNSKEVKFWTCGFFPGSLYCLLERCMKYPKYLPSPGIDRVEFQSELLRLCRSWAQPLHQSAERTNTHDLGFITQPALRQDWELTGNHESLKSILKAARNLASRYDERMGAVRSWDQSLSKRYHYTCKETNFLVIVDSMSNMDLLFYAGHHLCDQKMIDIATSHAHFIRRNLIREDDSSWHVINFDPRDGTLKSKHTHQGYNDDSAWARGQAWMIQGFAQTYIWTKDPIFLSTTIRLAEYFLGRTRAAKYPNPYVPVWDFDAPFAPGSNPLRDSSAGMIAANGLLLLHQILHNSSPYLDEALRIARDTIAYCQVPAEQARLVPTEGGKIRAEGVAFDAILTHATANQNEFAVVQYSDHGLVYADYYFLEFGNKLLRMGMV